MAARKFIANENFKFITYTYVLTGVTFMSERTYLEKYVNKSVA